MQRLRLALALVVLLALASACGSERDSGTVETTAGSAGAQAHTGIGGSGTGTGGATAVGGSGGGSEVGGTAGTTETGGTSGTGEIGGTAGAAAIGGAAGVIETGGTGGSEAAGAGNGGIGGEVMGGPGGSAASAGLAGAAGSAGSGAAGGAAGASGDAGGGEAIGSAGAGGNSGGGPVAVGQSCFALAGSECHGENCCQSILVPGGAFPMGRGAGADAYACTSALCEDETPEHDTTVADFYLERFEVSVGRFRAFVQAFDAGWRPTAGAGANPAVESAQGLAPGESGWQSAWNAELPADRTEFEDWIGGSGSETWTPSPGAREGYPISRVGWYEAFAFCIWDGGRLPTEAEWEYTAAGGIENRLYPWGASMPDTTLVVFDCLGDEVSGCEYATDILAVGAKPPGDGRWGHSDMAGNMYEWVLDSYDAAFYTTTQSGCLNCANLTASSERVIRGGDFYSGADGVRSAGRSGFDPTIHNVGIGFRCARTP
jgi:sulfatase modifying factor 1